VVATDGTGVGHVQLKQGLRVVRRATDEVQIGTDPRWAVRVSGLTREQADHLARIGDRPLDAWLPAAVLARLGQAGLLRARRDRTVQVPAALEPEARGYGLACDDVDGRDGADIVRRRARATVAVGGLDRLGLTVVTTLAAAGVGGLLLDDARLVRQGDVGGGYLTADVGRARARVAADLVRAQSPDVRLRRPRHHAPDVTVTVTTDVTDPGTALGLLSGDAVHLPVVVREADALVGPFVDPAAMGEPCVRCLDLHRSDADPAWPVVLAQLGTRDRRGEPGPPAALATVAAGIVAAEVLAHVDGRRPRTRGAQYEIPLPGLEPRMRRWAAHPSCGCAALAS
jgi:hypothetical protein